jgi:hypothetical protein
MAGKSPCKGCDRRTAECHGACAEYGEWKAAREQQIRERYETYGQWTNKDSQPFWRRLNRLTRSRGGRR